MVNKITTKYYKDKYNIQVKTDGLTNSEKLIIIKNFLGDNFNYNNTELLNKILENVSSNYPTINELRSSIMSIINPNKEKNFSLRNIKFWITRGFSEDEAKQKVSEIQSKNSIRTVAYWINKGFSEDEAKQKVSEIQSNYSKNRTTTITHFQTIYWINKGFSEDEAKQKVSEIQTKNAIKSNSISKLERQQRSRFSVEYWKLRYGNEFMYHMMKYLRMKKDTKSSQSKWALELINYCLTFYTDTEKLYYHPKEYGKFIPDHGYRKYDFVDTKNKIVIEFHGHYWHKYSHNSDKVKRAFMENLGFSYLELWDNEVKQHEKIKEFLIENKIY